MIKKIMYKTSQDIYIRNKFKIEIENCRFNRTIMSIYNRK